MAEVYSLQCLPSYVLHEMLWYPNKKQNTAQTRSSLPQWNAAQETQSKPVQALVLKHPRRQNPLETQSVNSVWPAHCWTGGKSSSQTRIFTGKTHESPQGFQRVFISWDCLKLELLLNFFLCFVSFCFSGEGWGMVFAMVALTDLKLGLILYRVLVLGLQAWATRSHFCNADLTNVKLVN